MQNLDQIRAAAAARLLPPGRKHDFDRSDVASLPALILTNGLLSAAAFCCEEGKEARQGMKAAFKGIAGHLRDRGLTTATDGNSLVKDLSEKDSLSLQRATAESLALLAYLKRFALKKEDPS